MERAATALTAMALNTVNSSIKRINKNFITSEKRDFFYFFSILFKKGKTLTPPTTTKIPSSSFSALFYLCKNFA